MKWNYRIETTNVQKILSQAPKKQDFIPKESSNG
jgi:hypothetical protein